jgi:hypothetical protein
MKLKFIYQCFLNVSNKLFSIVVILSNHVKSLLGLTISTNWPQISNAAEYYNFVMEFVAWRKWSYIDTKLGGKMLAKVGFVFLCQ